MTTSEALLARVRHAAMLGPDAGSDRARDVLTLCDEYEIAIEQGLGAEETIHKMVKAQEGLGKPIKESL
jgi:hypothetical protein